MGHCHTGPSMQAGEWQNGMVSSSAIHSKWCFRRGNAVMRQTPYSRLCPPFHFPATMSNPTTFDIESFLDSNSSLLTTPTHTSYPDTSSSQTNFPHHPTQPPVDNFGMIRSSYGGYNPGSSIDPFVIGQDITTSTSRNNFVQENDSLSDEAVSFGTIFLSIAILDNVK